jgi:hypothetical protein
MAKHSGHPRAQSAAVHHRAHLLAPMSWINARAGFMKRACTSGTRSCSPRAKASTA